MALAARQGDSVGPGVITGPCATKVFIEGSKAALFGDNVSSHGSGLHAASTINSGSSKVFIEGKQAVRVGDTSTCGHSVTTGATKTSIGG